MNMTTFSVKLKSQPLSPPLNYEFHSPLRGSIIDSLLRTYTVLKENNRLELVRTINPKRLFKIARMTNNSEAVTATVIRSFLKDIRGLSAFFESCSIEWKHTPSALYRKSRIYLHKVHKIAPVFDYTRAKFNLCSLHEVFRRAVVWPTIGTQLALTIYITDLYDKTRITKLRPSNIRAVSYCLAFAFYRMKNILIEKGVFLRDE